MSPRTEEQNKLIRDERREQILKAALEVFARRGYSAARISDIAAAARLSHGLVYHYFGSKDDVFTALVGTALAVSAQAVKAAAEGPGTPLQRLRNLTETLLAGLFAQKESVYYFLVMLQATTFDPVPRAVRDLIRQDGYAIIRHTIPLIKEGQAAGEIAGDDPGTLATAYWGLLQGLVITYAESGDPFPFPSADIVLRVLKA